jgi:hypothetical protein
MMNKCKGMPIYLDIRIEVFACHKQLDNRKVAVCHRPVDRKSLVIILQSN